MPVVCPTVTAGDPHEYREQLESLEPFAQRVHFDFMDGDFAPTVSPRLEQAWWPTHMTADLHIMYRYPTKERDAIVHLKPSLVIVHAEAEGDFVPFAKQLQVAGIQVGLALLPESPVASIASVLTMIDHVLVFGGRLGYHGGVADLSQLGKVTELKRKYPHLELGWDGGVNDQNIQKLVAAGVDVINVGSFVTRSEDPAAAYATLSGLIKQ